MRPVRHEDTPLGAALYEISQAIDGIQALFVRAGAPLSPGKCRLDLDEERRRAHQHDLKVHGKD